MPPAAKSTQKKETTPAPVEAGFTLADYPTVADALAAVRPMYDAGYRNQALSLCKEVLTKEPNNAEAKYLAGAILFYAAEYALGTRLVEEAAALDKTNVIYWQQLSKCYYTLNDMQRSFDAGQHAIQLDTMNAESHANMGRLFASIGDIEASIKHHRIACRLKPNSAEYLRQMCFMLHEDAQFEKADKVYENFVKIAPDHADRVVYKLRFPRVPQSTEHIRQIREKLSANIKEIEGFGITYPATKQLFSTFLFALPYHGVCDRPIMEQHVHMYRKIAPGMSFVAPHCVDGPKPVTGRKPRIAFISKYFYEHSVGKCYNRLIEAFAAEGRYDIYVLDVGSKPDAMRERIQKAANHFVTIPLALADAQSRIASLELDVLIYTDIGMDDITYMLAYARLAPVQCVLNGHPNTTGIDTLDYFISVRDMEPENAQEHYTERLILLDNAPVWFDPPPPTGAPLPRSQFSLPEDCTLYLCPMMQHKFHPEYDFMLKKILERDEKAFIGCFVPNINMSQTRDIHERMKRVLGPLAERVGMMPWQSTERFGHLLKMADAVIDTIYFTGGTTTALAIGHGVPMVTWEGPYMRSRVSAYLYRRIGVTDLICATQDEYIDKAIQIANDPDLRKRLSDRVAAGAGAIFADTGVMAEFRAIFDAFAQGKPPPVEKLAVAKR